MNDARPHFSLEFPLDVKTDSLFEGQQNVGIDPLRDVEKLSRFVDFTADLNGARFTVRSVDDNSIFQHPEGKPKVSHLLRNGS